MVIRLKIEDKEWLYVDSREPPKVIGKLSQWGIYCEREKLDVGDYESEKALIERKTVSDFEGTIIEDKLDRYANNMLRKSKDKVLFWIIEGSMGDIEKITFEQFYGAITKLSMRYGYSVIGLLPNLNACLYAIAKITTESQKLGRPYKISMPRNRPKLPIHILENVLRIPYSSAEELWNRYGSIQKVFQAINNNRRDILDVKGIGKVRLERMEELVNEDMD